MSEEAWERNLSVAQFPFLEDDTGSLIVRE